MNEPVKALPKLRFSLLSLLGITTWVGVAVFAWWNMRLEFAVMMWVLGATAIHTLVRLVEGRVPPASRKMAGFVILGALAVGAMIVAVMPHFVFAPRMRRETAEVARVVSAELREDPRFAEVHVGVAEFKSTPMVILDGTVASARTLDDLQSLVSGHRQYNAVWVRVEVEEP